jgi:hypothetical protein
VTPSDGAAPTDTPIAALAQGAQRPGELDRHGRLAYTAKGAANGYRMHGAFVRRPTVAD